MASGTLSVVLFAALLLASEARVVNKDQQQKSLRRELPVLTAELVLVSSAPLAF
jgi:hypothetical protein